MRAVVFDMDGLMINTEDVYTLAGTELLGRRGCCFTPELKDAMMGLPPRASFNVMIQWCRLDETWEALARESNEIFLGLLGRHLAVMPGLLDLLAALERADIPKAIATSSGRQLAEACLVPLDLLGRFQFVLTSEDVVRGKPNPDVYLLAAQRLGLPPGEIVVLEDSRNGCLAAAAAGTLVVAVPGEHSRRHDFRVADHVVASLADPKLYDVLGLRAEAS